MNKDVMSVQEVSPGYELVAENPAVPVGYKQTEVGVIPEDWGVASVSEITEQIMDFRGRTPRKLGMTWGGGDIPALSAANVRQGYIDFNVECYFGSHELYDKWMTKGDVRVNDILFTTEAPLGNVALIPDDKKYILSQRTVLLRALPAVADSIYLYQYLLSEIFQRVLLDYSSGSTAKGIQRKKLEQLNVPLPPLNEQSAIATALSDVDALLEELDRLIAKKRDIKQAAMQQLLTGKTRLPGFDGEWIPVKFSSLATLSNARIDPSRSEGSDFCIELEHINQGTGLLNGSTVTTETSSLKTAFEPGDVLFGKLRAYLRKYWIANRPGVCSTEIWVLKANSQLVLPQYLFQMVTTDSFIESASTAYGTHMPRSDWKVIRETQWSIPCINEQQAIAAVLSDMDTEIQALEQRRSKTAELKQGMMQELLTGRTRLV